MKLTITIDVDIKHDRRKLNNILANANADIHEFVSRSIAHEFGVVQFNGNQAYHLQIKIEE